MEPTETLKHEHQVILLVLDAAENEARRIRDTGKVDTERVEKYHQLAHELAGRGAPLTSHSVASAARQTRTRRR